MRTLPENSTSSPGCSSECKHDRDLDERHEPELSGPTWPGFWRSGRRSPAPGAEPPAARRTLPRLRDERPRHVLAA
jgi:hypothetical protein